MGRIITLEEAQTLPKGSQERDWAYNALDTTGTREIADTLLPRLNPNQLNIYGFERALQAPAMAMMARGVNVDTQKRAILLAAAKRERVKAERAISRMPVVTDIWDKVELETGICKCTSGKHHKWPRGVPDAERSCERCGVPRQKKSVFNANSSHQRAHLFYKLLKVPPQKDAKGVVSTGHKSLEKIRIMPKFSHLAPLITAILVVVDMKKQEGALGAKLSPDGRYMSSFNIGAAWTGRQSSSKNPFQEGGNLQNVAPKHRRVFIADYGMDIGYADYMQGESNLVAHLSGDERYIEAHRLGDVHTYVTRYVWPELPWTGDLAKDKKIAKQNPPWDLAEGHDYRFQCKRIQHGSNYGLSPFGIAMIAQIPLKEAKLAYERYMTEFDGIPAWQKWVKREVAEHNPLINPLGREVTLFGRPWDPHTQKQGFAFLPQSALADIMNIAMWRVWNELDPNSLHLLAQVHDALLFQYPRGELATVRRMLQLMRINVPVTDIHGITRTMAIGVEAAVGRNWGHISEDNPYGIAEKPIEEYLNENPL